MAKADKNDKNDKNAKKAKKAKKGAKDDTTVEGQNPAVTSALNEAAASAARRRGLGIMLAVVLALPAITAAMAGDLGARDLGMRVLAASVVGRLAVEFVARAVSPRERRTGSGTTVPAPRDATMPVITVDAVTGASADSR
jgi:hypothetical protein